jgi:UDP-N-acetylmuramate: L-alanyl-gamma-D-glutamyl-meso-diaminopimelate ligase
VAERIHFIGICGTAMATLAAMLQARGLDVQGSDREIYPPMSDFLARERIRVFDGYRAENIPADIDVVVVGNAISRGNPELEAVLDRKIRHVSLPEALREQFLWDARSVVIAGTHGKTTTTSLAGWLLTHGGTDPTVFIGGIARNFGNGGSSYRIGAPTAPFVIEGDEYDSAFFDKTAKFLKYLPDIAVVNNIEFDHADIYKDLDAVRLAFQRLVNLVPRRGLTLLGIDSAEAAALAPRARSRVQTFGTAEGAGWRAVEISAQGETTVFRLLHDGADEGRFEVTLVGAHNVRNALAAIAIGRECGVPMDTLREGLAAFRGVKRRLEVVGTRRDVLVYDDFAHHPTHLGHFRAAFRLVVPACLSGRFRPRLHCRRRSRRRLRVPLDAGTGGSSL